MIWKEWNNDYVAEMPYLTPIKVLADFCFCHLLFVLPLAIKTTMIIKVIITTNIIKGEPFREQHGFNSSFLR